VPIQHDGGPVVQPEYSKYRQVQYFTVVERIVPWYRRVVLVVVLELIEHDRGLSRRDEDDGLLGFRLRVPGGLG
jgi:hypothetical protein